MYLAERGYVSLNDIVAHLGTSISTARRDLEEMQRRGAVRRTRGGAVFTGARRHPLEYQIRESQNVAEKEAIGEVVAGFVRDGDAIILDGGTTTYRVAKRLRGRHIQVVTNSLPIAALLGNCAETELIFLGGYVMPQTGVSLGTCAEQMLRSLHVRLAVMGTAGVTGEGLFNAHMLMVELERLMMKAAEEVVVAVDHTKFGRKSLAKLCALNEIHHLVSDGALDVSWAEVLRSSGVKVHLAPAAGRDGDRSGGGG